MIETTEVIHVIYYILSKIKQSDKIKLISLIYLADKYHLLLYGRTITGDDYYAMEYGLAGSLVKDVLEQGNQYAEELFKCTNGLDFRIKEGVYLDDSDLDISESDKQALDFIIKKFGDTNNTKLSDYIREYPEMEKEIIFIIDRISHGLIFIIPISKSSYLTSSISITVYDEDNFCLVLKNGSIRIINFINLFNFLKLKFEFVKRGKLI